MSWEISGCSDTFLDENGYGSDGSVPFSRCMSIKARGLVDLMYWELSYAR
jgi:hypothetical protein